MKRRTSDWAPLDGEPAPQLFYPCIENSRTGRIDVKASGIAMSHADASQWLKAHYPGRYRNCEAIPQPVKMFE